MRALLKERVKRSAARREAVSEQKSNESEMQPKRKSDVLALAELVCVLSCHITYCCKGETKDQQALQRHEKIKEGCIALSIHHHLQAVCMLIQTHSHDFKAPDF